MDLKRVCIGYLRGKIRMRAEEDSGGNRKAAGVMAADTERQERMQEEAKAVWQKKGMRWEEL